MRIRKEYKLGYIAHRNQDLKDCVCSRPHGHIYACVCYFEVKRVGGAAVTTLFDDFDKVIEPYFKGEWDHRMLIDEHDKLYGSLQTHERVTGENLGLKVLPFPSSVENVSFYLFYQILVTFNLPLVELHIQETRSSTIVYGVEDFANDMRSPLGKQLIDFIKKTK